MEKLFLRSQAALATVSNRYHRPLFHNIDWDNALIAILGARGVGKTTLLLQRLKMLKLSPREALYADLGDLYFKENRLLDFVEAYIAQGGKLLFLDEVHRYGFGSWAQEIKTIYDLYRHRVKVIFSGSSVINILDQQADLSRRVRFFRMQGLSFREYLLLQENLEFSSLSLDNILQSHFSIAQELGAGTNFLPKKYLGSYWQNGYYPFFLDDPKGYSQRLNLVIQLVIDQDIPHAAGAGATKQDKIGRLLFAIASSPPFKPNISKLAERLELSRNTLLQYLQLLERAELISALRMESKGVSSLQKPDKVFLDNPNLIYALAPQQADIGAIREAFFYNQLSSLARSWALPPRIELPQKGDFIYSGPQGQYLFEIGGPGKEYKQIGMAENHYVVTDANTTAHPRKIPLWMFGFLY
ncbi:MAG: ATP-binding protein [Phaeodactylibacter sp.]|nr:ATP-binding protein [Phaeodactylibacter sp.]MCB9277195.1 ATP-binding protein [Lewinellaceae bacterium]